jgi:hypothetical protein
MTMDLALAPGRGLFFGGLWRGLRSRASKPLALSFGFFGQLEPIISKPPPVFFIERVGSLLGFAVAFVRLFPEFFSYDSGIGRAQLI